MTAEEAAFGAEEAALPAEEAMAEEAAFGAAEMALPAEEALAEKMALTVVAEGRPARCGEEAAFGCRKAVALATRMAFDAIKGWRADCAVTPGGCTSEAAMALG